MGDDMHRLIQAVSEKTGVPAELLTGDTVDAVWDSAQRLVDWKASTAAAAPQPPTAAVPASSPPPTRITPQGCVPDGDYLAAWRNGRLAPAGVPAPPPRHSRGMPW
jgi:hypothetical protein